MKSVILVMKRASVAQGLMIKMQDDTGIRLYYEQDYANADVVIRGNLAQVAIIEVAESGAYTEDYCLTLCSWLRMETPYCKLILMIPEMNEAAVQKGIEAKEAKIIDDFVFYDASMEYISDIIRAV